MTEDHSAAMLRREIRLRRDFELELHRFRRENARLGSELRKAQAFARELDERAQACEGAAVDASVEVLSLKAEMATLRTQAVASQNELAELRASSGSVQLENVSLRENVAATQAVVGSLRADKEDLVRQITEYKLEIEARKAKDAEIESVNHTTRHEQHHRSLLALRLQTLILSASSAVFILIAFTK